jgi:hypothetical protein
LPPSEGALGDRADIADELDSVAKKLLLAKPRNFGIADLIALISLAGMVYSFISSQSALQASVGMKLDLLERIITDLRKNSDSVPMISYKVDALSRAQEENERQRNGMVQDIREMHDGLIAMGVNLKAKR